jgi:hypothetical protein
MMHMMPSKKAYTNMRFVNSIPLVHLVLFLSQLIAALLNGVQVSLQQTQPLHASRRS